MPNGFPPSGSTKESKRCQATQAIGSTFTHLGEYPWNASDARVSGRSLRLLASGSRVVADQGGEALSSSWVRFVMGG